VLGCGSPVATLLRREKSRLPRFGQPGRDAHRTRDSLGRRRQNDLRTGKPRTVRYVEIMRIHRVLISACAGMMSLLAGTESAAFAQGTTGDPSSSARASLSPRLASLPLRLELQPVLFPVEPAMSSQACESHEDASGNTQNGFPLPRYAALHLTPQLSLHGFSTPGCPTRGGIGGAVTYAMLLKPDMWLVMGAGIYEIPEHAPFAAYVRHDARIDVVISRRTPSSSRPEPPSDEPRHSPDALWTIGVDRANGNGSSRGRTSIRFGGAW
jgi:hypothetical protein